MQLKGESAATRAGNCMDSVQLVPGVTSLRCGDGDASHLWNFFGIMHLANGLEFVRRFRGFPPIFSA